MPHPSTVAQALALLVLGYALVTGEPGLLIGMVGVALWAWQLARLGLAMQRRVTGSGPATALRALHQSRSRAAMPRAQDPNAAGHTRARAPSALLPAV